MKKCVKGIAIGAGIVTVAGLVAKLMVKSYEMGRKSRSDVNYIISGTQEALINKATLRSFESSRLALSLKHLKKALDKGDSTAILSSYADVDFYATLLKNALGNDKDIQSYMQGTTADESDMISDIAADIRDINSEVSDERMNEFINTVCPENHVDAVIREVETDMFGSFDLDDSSSTDKSLDDIFTGNMASEEG